MAQAQLNLLNSDKVYSIGELTGLIKDVLESAFAGVWVEGEISNYKLASSGHRYFSLKDASASLRCAMWRGAGRGRVLAFEPKDGMRVRAFGSLSVYPPRGDYQLIVSELIEIGVGPLEVAFQKLKEKLLKEGLFAEERKRLLPPFPASVGVVTSPTGAAFVDITRTITQRFPGMRIILAPVRVQGAEAAGEIIAAISAMNRRSDIDVLIVGRGGGSLEDLWPFNEEIVARAIAASRIPVVSAVGHEVDFTIADFVADFRAPTPTGAAERITDNWVLARTAVPQTMARLRRAVVNRANWYRQQWSKLHGSHALRRPADLLHLWTQRLDETNERLSRGTQQRLQKSRHDIDAISGKLMALSPEAVLRRGYSITRLVGGSRTLRDATLVTPGSRLDTTLASGHIISEVKSIHTPES
ncbi:MAG: exodeoxyribonuclease VII large subunit [candidate division Zixibacteria bacterium]|nr:exodeoxyribonuclease VII large subunit [candidate division Zixibacteria bacterium]